MTSNPRPYKLHATRKVLPSELKGRATIPASIRQQARKVEKLPKKQEFLAPKWLKLVESDIVQQPGFPQKYAQEMALHAYYHLSRPLLIKTFDEWIQLFQLVGLVDADGNPTAGGSSETITLYRGSNKRYPHGLSWTPYVDMAAYFALKAPNSAIFETRVRHRDIIAKAHLGDDLWEVILDSRRHHLTQIIDLNSSPGTAHIKPVNKRG